ncbi:DNA polymerase subunit Cdc27 [Polychytrium aggregatum]|uniref:DNA polymerase subunit Cdc27 n=1 Tax=Polychytrium aggregatum TaxID=110093 RepID=UPI0022FE61AD|nr:DNA polymerase subunit Cdc27 [Polychytrium aggregatum]KAI9206358.1 DNA polymerase subunit Cdc27 [Polychytrium aggregatum]
MTVDPHLQHIDSLLSDEGAIVTCKSLSRSLNVPVNESKTLLENYRRQSPGVHAIYFISGKTNQGAEIVAKFAAQEHLEEITRQLEHSSYYVYSLQTHAPKDTEAMFATDYQVQAADDLSNVSHFRAIKSATVEFNFKRMGGSSAAQAASSDTVPKPVAVQPKAKPEPEPGRATVAPKTVEKPVPANNEKSNKHLTTSDKRQAFLNSFVKKEAARPKSAPENSATKDTPFASKLTSAVQASEPDAVANQATEPGRSNGRSERPHQSGSKTSSPIQPAAKAAPKSVARRVEPEVRSEVSIAQEKILSDLMDDDEDEDGNEDDMAAADPNELSEPQAKRARLQTATSVISDEGAGSPSAGVRRVRKRRQKKVTKTFQEGKYLVTRDVVEWESYSEDEAEPLPAKPIQPQLPRQQSADSEPAEADTKGKKKKQSRTQMAGQQSLLSFFSKK